MGFVLNFSVLRFGSCDTTWTSVGLDCSIIAVSCFRFMSRWHSAVTACSDKFGSCSILFKILVRMSASRADCKPQTKIRHLNWSSVILFSWNFSHSRFTVPAYVTKSSFSFFTSFIHWYLVLNIDEWSPNIFINNFTVSSKF